MSEELKEETIKIGSDCVHFSRLPAAGGHSTAVGLVQVGRSQRDKGGVKERGGGERRSRQERRQEWATGAAEVRETRDSECMRECDGSFCTATEAFHMAAFIDIIETDLSVGKLGVFEVQTKNCSLAKSATSPIRCERMKDYLQVILKSSP